MQLRTPENLRPPHPSRTARLWTVNVRSRIAGQDEHGERVIVPAGRYILREIDEITYELLDSSDPALLTLRLSEVAAYWKSGAIAIDGMWP